MRPLRLAVISGLFFTALFGLAAALIAVDGLTDTAEMSDVVVVLGNEVLADGTPSDRLAARLDAAVEVHDQGLVDHVIVSGGTGRHGHVEAEVMADYLEEAGINPAVIVLDREGVNTRATAVNSAAIMDQRGWTSAIVATQFFHIARTELAFAQEGIEPVTSIHANYTEPRDAFGLAREVPAYIQYWLDG